MTPLPCSPTEIAAASLTLRPTCSPAARSRLQSPCMTAWLLTHLRRTEAPTTHAFRRKAVERSDHTAHILPVRQHPQTHILDIRMPSKSRLRAGSTGWTSIGTG